jgi:prolyl-tRNA synthetase
VTTRLIGAVIMTHGDDQGLKLPPRVAPIQAVVIPIWRKDEERAQVRAFVDRVKETLAGRVRLWVDDRDQYTPGWKYNEHELRGVPIRLEIGPRDVAQQSVMSVRRDSRAKEPIALSALAERLPALLDDIQRSLFQSAVAFRDENTGEAKSIAEVEAHFATKRGFVAFAWDGSPGVEEEIKDKTGATLRCMPLDQQRFAHLARDGQRVGLFARAY